MAYLENSSDYIYYNDSSAYGNYQFVSLKDVIDQFMVAYVGNEKLIKRASKIDVSFHAQRALAEMSFDTFKSVKAQQIDVPPSLSMILPKDYVNYTSVSWVDASGIKHGLYPTKYTSNPFQVQQKPNLEYDFPVTADVFDNSDFSSGLDGWTRSPQAIYNASKGGINTDDGTGTVTIIEVDESAENPSVLFKTFSHSGLSNANQAYGYCTYIYQTFDASNLGPISFSANATTTAASTITTTEAQAAASQSAYDGTIAGVAASIPAGTFNTPGSTVRIGFSTTPPSERIKLQNYPVEGLDETYYPTPNSFPEYFDLGYIEWTQGESGVKEYDGELDLSNASGTVYLVVMALIDHVDRDTYAYASSLLFDQATVDDVTVSTLTTKTSLSQANSNGVSSTFESFRSITPAENNNDDYKNDDYQRVPDERYGLDPQFAQTNGSFYIDERLGKINFSSNISGKTVILDYISDSLGTEAEMQVHKFAEEAMYRYINHAILATRVNVPEYIVRRLKKEKIASIRQAKLRLSNIKLEEITQIFRGKSKHIKH
jgi:hypothetical protein